jgi:threonine dehydrogenase-like Zn-dependent dehydrogenase
LTKQALIVYWSQTGNTEKVALALKEGLEAAGAEVSLKKPEEAAGTTETVEQTPFMVRKAGKVVLVGESKEYLNLEDADEAVFFTMYISSAEYPFAVELVANKTVDVKGLITRRFRFSDFERALRTADNPVEKALKVFITG